MSVPLVDVHELSMEYQLEGPVVRALDGVDLTVAPGEVVGLIGESGSGKTTLALAIGQLLPSTARRVSGDLMILGRSVFELNAHELRHLRAEDVGFVFQNPMSALDPTMAIREQLSIVSDRMKSQTERSNLLEKVGLTEPERVGRSYPHQLSGGMAQRVAIAMAIARRPKLVVADEPTASLDATVREHILTLLVGLCGEADASVLLLSHDLRQVGRHCSRVAVMYGGRVAELGPSRDVFRRPAHPYTQALNSAAPGTEGFGGWLRPIEGLPPILRRRSEKCAFEPRCGWAIDLCRTVRPESRIVAGRQVLCHRAEEVLDQLQTEAHA